MLFGRAMGLRRLALAVCAALCLCCAAAAKHLHHAPPLSDRPILFIQELEEFAELSEDDAKKHLGNLLQSLDNGLDAEGEYTGDGGDGGVDRGELAIRLTRVELDRMSLDAALHVDEADADGDGLLTWAELTQMTAELGLTPMLAVKRFAQADRNKDKYLTESEVIAYFHPDVEPRMFSTLAQEVIAMLDEDKSDDLDVSEVSRRHLDRLMPNRSQYAVHLDHLSPLLTHLDEDNNRRLSVKEMKKFIEEHYTERIEELVDAIFQVVDDNKDGMLTIEELWNNHEHLIGSHASRQHGATPPHKIQDALERRHHQHDHDGENNGGGGSSGPAHDDAHDEL